MNTNPDTKAPGDLDPTFGEGGILVLPAGFNTASAQLGDGKLVVAGLLDNDVALLRLNPDGTPDSGFGEAGVKRLYTLRGLETGVAKVEVFPDDSLVLQGRAGDFAAYLLRTLPSGDLDASFGNAGRSELAMPGGQNNITAMAALPDGKLLVVLQVNITFTSAENWLVRLDEGRPDLPFGGDNTGMKQIGINHTIIDLLVLPNGRLLLGGHKDWTLLLVQFLADGQFDKAFGEDGILIHDLPQSRRSSFNRLLRQMDGKIAAVGDVSLESGSGGMTARLLADGSFDPVFNGGVPWFVMTGIESVGVQHLALIQQRDGKLVAGGGSLGTFEQSQLWLTRFHPVTGLDPTFGEGGTAKTQLGGFDLIRELFLQPDGKILAVAMSLSADTRAHLVRYLA